MNTAEGHIIVLGNDNVIHCAKYSDTSKTACEKHIPVKRINPNFDKLRNILWCYECSAILEEEDS